MGLGTGLCVCLVASVTAAAFFMPRQSLWLDEAVQMSGLSLDPVAVTRWLVNQEQHSFDLPDDRMPPLSYWMGWIWSRLFGLAEQPLRWMGVVAVGCAVVLVFAAAQRAWGLSAGLAAGLLLGLSPNVIVTAVEIRTYPLLLLASAGAFFCLLRLAEGVEPGLPAPRGWLAGLTVCGIAAMYLHFFGLVLVGSTLLAALVIIVSRGGRPGTVILAGVVAVVAALGLIPFVVASQEISTTAEGLSLRHKLTDFLRLAYRQVGHASMSVHREAVAAAFLGAALAAGAALWPRWGRSRATVALIMALVSGGVMIMAAQLVQTTINAAAPHYNIWALPGLILLLASGLGATTPIVRRVAAVGIVLWLGADLFGSVQLRVTANISPHVAYRPVADLVRQYGPDRVTIVHDGDDQIFGHFYSPLRYDFGPRLRQYVHVPDGPNRDEVIDFPGKRNRIAADRLSTEYLIVLHSRKCTAVEVVDQLQHGPRTLADDQVAKVLTASPRWSRLREATYVAYYTTDVDVFRATTPSPAPAADPSNR